MKSNEPSKDTDNAQATQDRPIFFKLNRNDGEILKEEHQKMHNRVNKEVSILYQINPFPLQRSSDQVTSGPMEWRSASYSRVRLNTTGNTGKRSTTPRNESINNGFISPAAICTPEKNLPPEPDQAAKSSLSVSLSSDRLYRKDRVDSMTSMIKPYTSLLTYSLMSKSNSVEEDQAENASTSQSGDNMPSIEADAEWDELFDLDLSKTTDINNNEPSDPSPKATSPGTGNVGHTSSDNISSGENRFEREPSIVRIAEPENHNINEPSNPSTMGSSAGTGYVAHTSFDNTSTGENWSEQELSIVKIAQPETSNINEPSDPSPVDTSAGTGQDVHKCFDNTSSEENRSEGEPSKVKIAKTENPNVAKWDADDFYDQPIRDSSTPTMIKAYFRKARNDQQNGRETPRTESIEDQRVSETPRSGINEPDQHMEKAISTPSFDETNHQSRRGTPTSNSTNPHGWPLEETQEWDHRAERKPEAFNEMESDDRCDIQKSTTKQFDQGVSKTPMSITKNQEDQHQTKTTIENDVLPQHLFNDITGCDGEDLLMKLFPNKLKMPSYQPKENPPAFNEDPACDVYDWILDNMTDERKLPETMPILEGTDIEYVKKGSDFVIVGNGGYANVYLCRIKTTGQLVVLKLNAIKSMSLDKLVTECAIQYKLNATGKVAYLHGLVAVEQSDRFLQLGIVSEFVGNRHTYEGKTLARLMQEEVAKNSMGKKEWLELGLRVIECLQALQKHKIVHGDLKPDNILLRKKLGEWIPLVADFGLSGYKERAIHKNIRESQALEFLVKFPYIPPEYVYERKLTMASDVFSLGILLVMMGDVSGLHMETIMHLCCKNDAKERAKLDEVYGLVKKELDYILI